MPKPRSAEAPPPLRLADFLPYRLSVVGEAVSRAFADRYEAEFGLSIPEWRVMAILGEGPALSTQSVIARSEMDRVKVSRAVISLVAKALVARTPHPQDQRAQILRLAPEGLALYRRIVPRAHGLQAELAESLTPEEQRVLDTVLHKLHRRAAALMGREEPSSDPGA